MYKAINVKRATGVSIMSLALVVGFSGLAGATSMGTIDKTGPDSTNIIRHKSNTRVRVHNNNNLNLTNSSGQGASSGTVTATHNTTAGGAQSGDAANNNSVNATVEVSNTAPMMAEVTMPSGGSGSATAEINNTGPDSTNKVISKDTVNYRVRNDNSVSVNNSVSQSASSGSATVSDNTTGGDAMSGNVSNSSSSSFTVHVNN